MNEFMRAVDAIRSAGGPFSAVGMVRFNNPWWLLALLGLLPLIAVQLRERQRAPRLLTSVVNELRTLPATYRTALIGLPRGLIAIAFALGAIAMARPDL